MCEWVSVCECGMRGKLYPAMIVRRSCESVSVMHTNSVCGCRSSEVCIYSSYFASVRE